MNLNPVEKKDINYIHKKTLNEFKTLAGQRILITGANGFLSFYFIKSFLEWNDKHSKNKIHLTLNSRFKNGYPQWISEIKVRKDIDLLKKDISKIRFNSNDCFDYIIHAASIASPIAYRAHPIETMYANVQGLTNLLEYMRLRRSTKKSVKGLLYFSSSEIYGDPTSENIPTPETYRGNVSCTGPRACYDESKRYCETLSMNYFREYNLPVRIARPFNNYGPGLRINDGRVIPDFAKNILEQKNIIMYSDGSPRRTFCYVADAIIGYIKILTKGKSGESYNIGVQKPEISIKELATMMIRIARKTLLYKGRLIFNKSFDKEYLTDNPQRRCPLIDKAKKELGYNPEITLEDGLTRSLMWYIHITK